MAAPAHISFHSFSRRLLLYYVIILIGLAVICIFFYRNNRTFTNTANWLKHTQKVINETLYLSLLSKDLQWENRNFITTGNKNALQSYLDIRKALNTSSATLSKLTLDNPVQKGNVAVLLHQLTALENFSDEGIRKKQETGYIMWGFDANINQQVAFHQQVNRSLQKIRNEENRLLTLREAENNKSIAARGYILMVAGGLTFLLLLLSFFTIYFHLLQRQRAEKTLIDNENRFQLLINGIKDLAIFMTDAKGNILNWYKGASNLKGYRYEEVIGKNISIFYTPEDVANGEPAVNLQLAAQLGSFEAEGWRVRKDGSRFWADILITAIYDDDGQVQGFAKVTRDFSLYKKATDESIAALEKERHLNQMKSNFVSLASHEFRTPLSTILSSVSLLEQYRTAETQDKRDKHIQRIKSSVADLVAILEEFLTLEKIDEGKVDVKSEPYNIREQIEQLCQKFISAEKLEHIFNSEHNGNEIVFLDKAFLNHILTNLISNAIKYSPALSAIYIFSEADHQSLKLMVKDEGIGISEKDQQQLFDRFFRASNTGNIKGTGLGLHIVKRYVDLLGGSITVESQLGRGTTFTVILPFNTSAVPAG